MFVQNYFYCKLQTNRTGLLEPSSTASDIKMAWSDNSDEAYFEVRRKDVGDQFFTRLFCAPANATSFSDITAELGESYVYKVGAVYPSKGTEWSNAVQVNTSDLPE